jgi:hypothetical protein
MNKGMWAIAAVLGVALGVLTTPASAAPTLGADAAGMKSALAEASPVEKARWVRRCWRDWRGWHCRRVWIGRHFGWAPFYGPRFGLYYGGRHRHFRGHGFRGGPRFRGSPHFRGGMGFRGAPRFRGGGRHVGGGRRGR